MAKASANKPTVLRTKRGRAASKVGSISTKRKPATIVLEDNFAEAFKEFRGKVDPKLKLGF
jgi:hypothetical protein